MAEPSTPSPAPTPAPASYTSFDGHRRIAAGSLGANALAVKRAQRAGAAGPLLTFSDRSGRVVDLDLRGSDDEVLARLHDTAPHPVATAADAAPVVRGRGRPRLGVVAREVTLLPRHWDWLAAQPGGASVTLRKLVEQARRAGAEPERRRHAQERTYHYTAAIAGNLPGFEEATRALFAGDAAAWERHTASWPGDVREHARRLATPDPDTADGATP